MVEDITFWAILLFLVDWAIKLAFILYIPMRRSPSSAIAWLLILLLVPYIGLFLFLLLGSPKLSRYRRRNQKYIDGLIEKHSPVKSNQLTSLSNDARFRAEPIAELALQLGKFPALEGNRVKVLPRYDEAIADIVKTLDQAKRYVHVEYFIINYDDATKAFFKALGRAVKRGVKVRVLIDAMGYRGYPKIGLMKKVFAKIGVEYHFIMPIKFTPKGYNRPDLRNHRKLVMIDDKYAYVGSLNMIDRSYHRKNDIYHDEVIAQLSGPAVGECNAVFLSDWYLETGDNIGEEVHIRELPPAAGKAVVQLLPSGPNFEHRNNVRLFVEMIHAARESVVITNPYLVPTEAIMEAMTSAAMRGVQVTIINSEVMDQWAVGHAQRSYYQPLLEAGVKIYLYKAPILLHSKHMTIDDDISWLGSSNMDIRSFELDLEVIMIAYDKNVVKELRKVQAHDIARSKQVKLGTWKKRGLGQKFSESVARLTSSLQ